VPFAGNALFALPPGSDIMKKMIAHARTYHDQKVRQSVLCNVAAECVNS